MKNIQNYNATKYLKRQEYKKVEHEIYEYRQKNDVFYVTSLSFVQEPGYQEGKCASEISQYPLEDLLDKFYCHISDYYEELNVPNSEKCYLEFAASEIDDIKNLRSIIGKHVYNKKYEEAGNVYVKLVIE